MPDDCPSVMFKIIAWVISREVFEGISEGTFKINVLEQKSRENSQMNPWNNCKIILRSSQKNLKQNSLCHLSKKSAVEMLYPRNILETLPGKIFSIELRPTAIFE